MSKKGGVNMTIGEIIKHERLRNNLSQEDVARNIGSTKQAIYKYENSIVTNIPMDKIEKMAALFGVSPAYIMGWETKTKPQIAPNLNLFDGRTEEERETEEKLLALYDKIEDKEGLIRFIERLSALSAEQQKFVFKNLLQDR
jgi:transcriptional regulator with XRE-family HTH domain